MRLREERIGAIARKIAFELVKKRFLKTPRGLDQVTAWVEKPMLDNLRHEDEIDELVKQDLAKLAKCPPEGSFEYQAMFLKKKEEIARRHGYEV
jgi:hypothetical protein